MKILMEHPNLGSERRQTVDAEQFFLVWEANGWVEIERTHETGDPDVSEAVIPPPSRPSWEEHEEWEKDHAAEIAAEEKAAKKAEAKAAKEAEEG